MQLANAYCFWLHDVMWRLKDPFRRPMETSRADICVAHRIPTQVIHEWGWLWVLVSVHLPSKGTEEVSTKPRWCRTSSYELLTVSLAEGVILWTGVIRNARAHHPAACFWWVFTTHRMDRACIVKLSTGHASGTCIPIRVFEGFGIVATVQTPCWVRRIAMGWVSCWFTVHVSLLLNVRQAVSHAVGGVASQWTSGFVDSIWRKEDVRRSGAKDTKSFGIECSFRPPSVGSNPVALA